MENAGAHIYACAASDASTSATNNNASPACDNKSGCSHVLLETLLAAVGEESAGELRGGVYHGPVVPRRTLHGRVRAACFGDHVATLCSASKSSVTRTAPLDALSFEVEEAKEPRCSLDALIMRSQDASTLSPRPVCILGANNIGFLGPIASFLMTTKAPSRAAAMGLFFTVTFDVLGSSLKVRSSSRERQTTCAFQSPSMIISRGGKSKESSGAVGL